jgi:hypothetical protein
VFSAGFASDAAVKRTNCEGTRAGQAHTVVSIQKKNVKATNLVVLFDSSCDENGGAKNAVVSAFTQTL